MQRDMELIRKILLTIEEQYVDVALYDIKVEEYDFKTIAYHCSILYDAGLICDYGSQYADNKIWSFGVGSLTWEGHEFLDKIRDDSIWGKTKNVMKENRIPFAIEAIKQISTHIIDAMIQSALRRNI